MNTTEYQNFLKKIAQEVDKMVMLPQNMATFREEIRPLVKRWKDCTKSAEKYQRDYKQHLEQLKSNPIWRSKKAGPPIEGWVWCNNFLLGYVDEDGNWLDDKSCAQIVDMGAAWRKNNDIFGCWTPVFEERSTNPLVLLCPEQNTGFLPKPIDKENEYKRYYVVLTSVHDSILPETESISRGVWPEELAILIWRFYIGGERYYSDGKFIGAALEHVQDDLAEKSAEAGQNAKRIVAAILISFIMVLLFELSVYFGPVTLIKNHPRNYGIQGNVICLIPCLIFGFFKPRWRKWWWGAAIAFLVGLLALL